MLNYLRSLLSAKENLVSAQADMLALQVEIENLRQIKHSTTLEELQDKPEDIETMKEHTSQQRLAAYRFLTARAYRLNDDVLRKAALSIRNDLMAATKSAKNTIPFDRESTVTKPQSFLPDVLKADTSKPKA